MGFKLWLEERDHFYFDSPKGLSKLPMVYIRFGDFPTTGKGEIIRSKNYLTGEIEPGISVYAAYYDRITKKFILQSGSEQLLIGQQEIIGRPIYLVSGKFTGEHGSDGEPLLDPETVKIIKKINIDDIVDSQDNWRTLSGRELEDKDIPNIPYVNPVNISTEELKIVRSKIFPLAKEIANNFKDLEAEIVLEPEYEKIYFITDENSIDVLKILYQKYLDPNNWGLKETRYTEFDSKIKLFKIKNGKVNFSN